MEATEVELEDGEYFQYDVEEYVAKIRHLEEQLGKLNDKV
jgi:hypothetical protein